MQLHNMKAAYPLMQSLYGCSPSTVEFEEFALQGWQLLNNKHTHLYRFIKDTENKRIPLPCNCYMVESVHLPIEDAQMTSNKTVFNHVETMFIESYINVWKRLEDPLFTFNKLVKYREEDNSLYFARDYDSVMVVYHGIICDEEDSLPMLTDKELTAIAAYVAYVYNFKLGLQQRSQDLLNIANMLKAEWLRACNAARIPEYLSQNDMDSILDAKVRWDRKSYGKGLKPML